MNFDYILDIFLDMFLNMTKKKKSKYNIIFINFFSLYQLYAWHKKVNCINYYNKFIKSKEVYINN